ncbi:MAG: amino acid transporter, partial [Candidatus Methanoperedens sp.]|nr:amino acid transporter [Candidatus Methanoperedens sp.]
PFKVPLNAGRLPLLPFLGMLSCVFMLAQLEGKVILTGVMLVVIGLIISFFESKKCKFKTG